MGFDDDDVEEELAGTVAADATLTEEEEEEEEDNEDDAASATLFEFESSEAVLLDVGVEEAEGGWLGGRYALEKSSVEKVRMARVHHRHEDLVGHDLHQETKQRGAVTIIPAKTRFQHGRGDLSQMLDRLLGPRVKRKPRFDDGSLPLLRIIRFGV